MDVREYAIASMVRVRNATLATVKDLTQDDLAWRPAPFANPIGFLLFHTFRTQDRLAFNGLVTGEEVWKREGWNTKWTLPQPFPDAPRGWYGETGNSWTPQQVAAWPIPPKDELLAYGIRSLEASREVVKTFDVAKLNTTMRPDRPDFTYAAQLHLLSHHEAQHQAQIDYILGLKRGVMGV